MLYFQLCQTVVLNNYEQVGWVLNLGAPCRAALSCQQMALRVREEKGGNIERTQVMREGQTL